MRYLAVLALTAAAAFAQTPTITNVVNSAAPGAGNAGRLCPGLLALVNGTNLGTSTSIVVTVTINGAAKKAAVLTANNTQLKIEIPVDAPLGAGTITAGTSAPFNINLFQFAPQLLPAQGGVILAFHQDQTQVTQSSPALAGEQINFPMTGLGLTAPVVPTGTPANGNESYTQPMAVTVGGTPGKVNFAGVQGGQIGQYYVGVTLPSSGVPSGTPNIIITVGAGTGAATASNQLPINFQALPSLISVNNYSGIVPGLPNYGIAPGSIFLVFGNNLANSNTGFLPPPLKSTVNGVTVNVVVNGTTVNPFIYYVTSGQLALVLPGNTPTGDGQISVVNNGTTIGPAPIHVVAAAPGVLTYNGLGTGMADMFDANFKYISFTNSVQPGEYVNLFGSGIGASPDSDQNVISPQTNLLGKITAAVDVGGQPAQITYIGRSAYPGLDQIQFIVPTGVTPGCYVGMVVRMGNITSNFTTMPVTAGGSGRTCAEPTAGITAANWQAISNKASFNIGIIDLAKETDTNSNPPGGGSPVTTFTDIADVNFLGVPTAPFMAADLGNPSLGSCHVYTWSGEDHGPMGKVDSLNFSGLNAGPAVNVSGPNGKTTLNSQGGEYGAQVGGLTDEGKNLPIFIPSSGGTFNLDNGSGGPDVKAFTASMTVGALPVWNNLGAISNFNRLNPPTITWTGGNSSYFAVIVGSSGTFGPLGQVGASFACAVPSTSGQFVLPSDAALSLPAGSGQLGVEFHVYPGPLNAPGVDLGFYQFEAKQYSYPVTFQ
jgi:uncharacterized protein (TIGR03437 family)